MCESRAVRSGKVYRQLFDAQVQLSRSLLAGRRDTRTVCLSADSNTHSSTISRLLSSSSRGQQVDNHEVDDVSQLPTTLAAHCPSSDIMTRLTEKRCKNHTESLRRLDAELTKLAEVCETQVRTFSEELLSFLKEVDLRLDTLKDRMEQVEHLDDVTLQDLCGLWAQVEKEMKLKKTRVVEMNLKLSDCETQRTNEIRAVLRKYCQLLEKISFLLPPDIHRLIHTEAMLLNQSLLANRRNLAHLLLVLKEEILQQESLLRLCWEDFLSRWRRSRVTEVIEHFRSLCSSDEDQQLISVQQINQTQPDLTEQRCDLISRISSLVPPTCSTALVSDWFNQLAAVNQQIDSLHAEFLHQLRLCYEQKWQQRLTEVEHCKEALSALQLSEVEVNDIVSLQLLPLIGRLQNQDEERLAALDECCDSVARHALSLSRSVFVVMRGAALLWETHNRRLETREEELQQHLNDLRLSQLEQIQGKKMRLDDLLAGLREQSSEDTLKTSLEKTVLYLQEIKDSYSQCISEQWEVLDRLPSLFLDELLSYSSSLSSFYHLGHTYTLGPDELQKFHLSTMESTSLTISEKPETEKPEEMTHNHPISCQNDVDPAKPPHDWLTEAESSLLDLYDISNYITFTSSSSVTYTGPAFRCPIPNLQENLKKETHLSLFPLELLSHTLSMTRTLFLDKLEQHFHGVLESTVAMVTDKKEAVCLDQELQLQLLNPQYIETHLYQPRLDELLLHRQCVEVHCGEVLDVLTSCRMELRELQASISSHNSKITVTLSNMEDNILSANSNQQLEALGSTLQDCVNQHIKHTQSCQTAFRKTVHIRLEEVRNKTTGLLSSFRLFSEGGEFAPQELKMLQKRLKEETKHITATEQSIFSELEVFESKSLQQVKKMSDQIEEKLSLRMSEVKFIEKIDKIINSTRIQIRAEAACSNQHQSTINSRLEDMRRSMEDAQVSPDQVCCIVSSIGEDLRRRSQYLIFEQEDLTLSASPMSRKRNQSAPPGLLQPSKAGVTVLDDPATDIIKFLNRLSLVQEEAAAEDRDRTGLSSVQHIHQRCTESVSARRGCRSIRTDQRFQIFGPEPEQEPQSFMSTVKSILWKTNNVLLVAAEDFYQSERHGRFQLLPEILDQWAESMQQRLLGYQKQAMKLMDTSRKALANQQSLFRDLLHSLPSVLISNYEQQQEVGFVEMVDGLRKKQEECLAASEQDKKLNVQRLRVSLRENELQLVVSKEEARQQQLHGTICCLHMELQECMQAQGKEFITSLASLTEKLLSLLDDLLTPAVSHQHSDSTVTMETAPKPEETPGTGNRTWPGIPYLSPYSSTEPATTPSITTTRCTMGHVTVIEQRDAAVKRFEQLFRSEMLRSDVNKQKQLSEIETWNEHWRQQINTLKHINTLTHTDTHASVH
ncbi:coiled-coil domain-containing protein 180 isoform X2 [Solea solea]|uniref:coiled-coil domain-containing protein 180 isoform X2 n=1 Tax=Solea solea TaxID=90069 RepID=UPI00272B932E|nr:coiled-coil domain-containing protein 180 isoform X2 [Solea solea]